MGGDNIISDCESVIKKIPYALILGDKEKDSKTISFRRYGSEDITTVLVDEFITKINKEIKDKNRIDK